MGEAQERVILGRAIAGDQAALAVLLVDSMPKLSAYIAAKIPSSMRGALAAEDIVQDAHIEVFRHIGTFEPRDEDSFDRWVTTIALRKLRNKIEKHRSIRHGGGLAAIAGSSTPDKSSVCALLDFISADGQSPSQSAAGHEAVAAVQAGLEFLPNGQRKAVSLVYIEGKPVALAARELGCSEQAVYNLCHRAKERLRDVLQSALHYLSKS